MKVYKEYPETSKDESAYLEGDTLVVEYHKWMKENYYYVDATFKQPIKELVTMRLQYGSRGGFKKMYMVYGSEFEVFELSKNHKELITTMYKLLKGKIEIKKEVI